MMSRTCSVIFELLVIVGLVWRAGWHASAQSPKIALVQLETDAAPQPLGIDDRNPRFSWALDSRQRGISKTVFRVLVASKLELAREGQADKSRILAWPSRVTMMLSGFRSRWTSSEGVTRFRADGF
jgi:hypothetical protein